MRSTWNKSKRACGCSSRSSPTAAPRPPRRSKRLRDQDRIQTENRSNEPFEIMVVLIVAIVMFASIIRARYGIRPARGATAPIPEDRAETLRLRDEVKELKERLKVLERITVEKENSLAKEIEELRDR